MNILDVLFRNKDEKYADFHSKLIPNISRDTIIGVRVPIIRKITKQIIGTKECDKFINSLPHKYYDENMLHGLVISNIEDFDDCILKLRNFLPYVDNWAVCDIMNPKVLKTNKVKLLTKIKEWISSNDIYTCRFGLTMLMRYFLDEDFKEDYLLIVSKINLDDYYVKMAAAWFFATALSKQWDSTIKYIDNNCLDIRTHNKTIQKAKESFRITNNQKEYLDKLKR